GKIVEFIGITGAGKSTLCNFARDEFVRAGVNAVDSQQVLLRIRDAHFAAWLVSRLGKTLKAEKRLLRHIRARGLKSLYSRYPEYEERFEARLARMGEVSPTEAAMVRTWVETKLADFELIGAKRADWSLCFWEEGIALRSVNLFALVADVGEPEGAEQFVRQWPMPDALVHVRVSVDAAFDRLEQRGHGKRLVLASEQEKRRFLARSERVVDAIITEASRREVPVFTLDNTLEIEKPRDRASSQLEGWAACAEGLTRLVSEA
ncbi:MAG: hypothetical protein VCB43_05560, partial [Myxococcota bacterium]